MKKDNAILGQMQRIMDTLYRRGTPQEVWTNGERICLFEVEEGLRLATGRSRFGYVLVGTYDFHTTIEQILDDIDASLETDLVSQYKAEVSLQGQAVCDVWESGWNDSSGAHEWLYGRSIRQGAESEGDGCSDRPSMPYMSQQLRSARVRFIKGRASVGVRDSLFGPY